MTSTNGRRSADERVDAKDVEMETHEHEPNDDDDDEDVRRSVSEVKRQHDDQCWICLDGDTAGRELYHPCACPRWAHAKCMARWQLQCSGKPEEVMCKFCAVRLPDWRNTLFQDVVRANEDVVAVTGHDIDDEEEDTATTSAPQGETGAPGEIKGDIIVKFNNISFRCQVRTGPEGLADFMRQIRDRCGIPEDKMKSLNLTYRCKDPSNGTPMTLEGLNSSAFDAAVLCSAVQDKMKHQSRVNSAVQLPLSSEITSRDSRRLSGQGRVSCDGRRRSHDGSELVSAFRRYT